MVPSKLQIEAKRGGYSVWANVNYSAMAQQIRDRLYLENPKYDPSIGLMPDDSWVIWYLPIQRKSA